MFEALAVSTIAARDELAVAKMQNVTLQRANGPVAKLKPTNKTPNPLNTETPISSGQCQVLKNEFTIFLNQVTLLES